MKRILIACAIKEEQIDWVVPGVEIDYVLTGVGKVNAAIHLMQAIACFKPDVVINAGTAGTLHFHVGDILVCTDFVDRDLEKIAIHGVAYHLDNRDVLTEEPFAGNWPSVIASSPCFTQYTVNTGDDFVVKEQSITGDVVDMEAYAEAQVCREYGIPFFSVKYITDVIGRNSVQEWAQQVAKGQKDLSRYFRHRTIKEEL